MTRKREPAARIFAKELNLISDTERGEDRYDPTYGITPFGRKISRALIAGVALTVKEYGGDYDLVQLETRDPTGTFYVKADNYSKAILPALKAIETPCYVKVVGKLKTYQASPEDRMWISIKPEDIRVITEQEYHYWINETLKLFKDHYIGLEEVPQQDIQLFEDIQNSVTGFLQTSAQDGND